MTDDGIDFGAMLREMAADDEPAAPLPEAQIDELRRMFAHYQEGVSRFDVGQLVTPMAASDMKGAGVPHLIVEKNSTAEPAFDGDPGSNRYGRRCDMRVLCWLGGSYSAYWVESWQFEPYTA